MPMKKRYIVLTVLLCLVLVAGAFLVPRVCRMVEAYRLMTAFLFQPEQSLDVTVQLDGDREVEFRLDWRTEEGKRVFVLKSGEEAVYFCDGVLYLKNGKGYRFEEALSDLSQVLEKPWMLAPVVRIAREGYHWQVDMETAEVLPELDYLSITMEENLDGIETLSLRTSGRKLGSLTGVRTLTRSDRVAVKAPQEVLDAIKSGIVQADKDLTRDILRLVKGWMLLSSTDPLGVKMDIQVDLLELPLHTQLELYSTKAYEKPIHYLNKDGVGLYFTDGAACTPEGKRIGSPEIPVDMTRMLGLAYYLCFNGDLSCQGDRYRLELNQAGMEQVLYAIAPETADMALTLEEGALELIMAGDAISSVNIAISGQVDLVITQVEIAARVGMEILQADFGMEVHQKVLDTLLAD